MQHDLRDMEREFQLEKERKQLQVMRGLLRKAFPEIEVKKRRSENVIRHTTTTSSAYNITCIISNYKFHETILGVVVTFSLSLHVL